VIDCDGELIVMFVGWIEDMRLVVVFGYWIVFRLWVCILIVVYGGFGGGEFEFVVIMDEVL